MALYKLEEFKSLVRSDECYCFNTSRANRTIEKLEWDDADFSKMLCGLAPSDFQKTVARCKVNDLQGYSVVNADQYEIHWDEDNGVRRNHPGNGTVSLSLKIAIVCDDQGTCAGVVTFHISSF